MNEFDLIWQLVSVIWNERASNPQRGWRNANHPTYTFLRGCFKGASCDPDDLLHRLTLGNCERQPARKSLSIEGLGGECGLSWALRKHPNGWSPIDTIQPAWAAAEPPLAIERLWSSFSSCTVSFFELRYPGILITGGQRSVHAVVCKNWKGNCW